MNAKELQDWFENIQNVLENAYIRHPDSEPWRQSGMSGPLERWVSLRKPLAGCIHRSGSFLDIGCANGYLLECLLQWTSDRGITIEPYGLDISSKLVQMARSRLPQYADRIFVGNSYDWEPPVKFDYVRTELVYVPAKYEREYIERLFERCLKPDGRLIIANYVEGLPNPEQGCLPGSFATNDILAYLKSLNVQPLEYMDGHDPIKNRTTRFVVLTKDGLG